METNLYDNDLNNLINKENYENQLSENEIEKLKKNLIENEELTDDENEEIISSEDISINEEINNNYENEKKIKNIEKNKIKNNKYEDLSITQIKEIIGKRNKKLLQLNEEKEKSKEKLKNIVKKINNLYEISLEYIKNKGQYTLNELKEIYEKREKELKNAKKINQTFKSQFLINLKKLNNVLSPEKISSFKKEINTIKQDNSLINQQIKELKSKSVINSFELKTYNENKKFPSKINNYFEDVKSFSTEKHDYYIKLKKNRKSLDNLIKEKNLLNKLYNSNIKESADNNEVSYLNYWLKLINQDLEGTEDEIFEKIENNKSKVINEIDKRRLTESKKNKLQLPILTDRSYNEKGSRNKISLLNVNKSENFSSLKKPYKGIFNKYSLLKDSIDSNISNSNLIVNKKKPRIVLKSIAYLKKGMVQNILQEFSNDYFATSEDDYRELLGKKEQFIKINSSIENKIRENSKYSSDKLNKISRNINDNITRLNILNQKNKLLNNEIINLENLLRLTFQQNEIKNEIKKNESKFMLLNKKKINDLNYNNENISQEPKENENKEFKINLNDISEKNEKKIFIPINLNQKITKKIKLFNDIKTIKKLTKENLKEDLIREKKIKEIKNKYFPIDNNENIKLNVKNNYNLDDLGNETINNNKRKKIFNKIIKTIEQK